MIERHDSIYERVQDMKPLEAVEYLLDVLENVAGALLSVDTRHEVDSLVSGLTPAQRRILIVLWDAQGRIVSREACFLALSAHKTVDEQPMPKTLNSHICHLRKKLPESMRITCVHGRGYMLERGIHAEKN